MKTSKKAFTLVELIIVIAIIAILAVTAFLLLTKRLSKARDSSRASNLANIENSLQISLTENSSLPKPDSYTLIYASGTSNVIGYQGYFGEGAKDSVGNINSAPKDGDDYFTYYLNTDLNKYQLAGFMENEIAYNPNVVSAVDYASRYVNVRGEKLGLLTDSNKNPLQTLGLTGLNILSGDRTYIAYYDNSTNLSLSGQSLITMLSLGNKNSAQYDTGLVFYSDMETTTNSGGQIVLKDLSNNGKNLICGKHRNVNAGNPLYSGFNCSDFILSDGKRKRVFNFRDEITVFSLRGGIDLPETGGTYSFWISPNKISSMNTPLSLINHYNARFRFTDSQIASRDDDATNLSGNYKMNTDNWYFLTFVINNDKTEKIYINGESLANGLIYSQDINWHTLILGARFISSPIDYFNGLMDEVRIYKRALTDNEVKALYNATN